MLLPIHHHKRIHRPSHLIIISIILISMLCLAASAFSCFLLSLIAPSHPLQPASSLRFCLTTPSTFVQLPLSSLSPFLDSVHISFLLRRNCSISSPPSASFALSLILILAGDIQLTPGSVPLKLAHLNVRSLSSITPILDKPFLLADFISDFSIELLAISETWLSPDTPPAHISSFTPDGFSFIHSPRLIGHGGGVGLMYRSYLNLSHLPIPSFSSFEAIAASFKISSSSYTILNVYRPPSLSVPLFLSDFTQLLESLVPLKSDLLITGDFNIHIDQKLDPQTISFNTLLATFDLSQHVTFKTHIAGHTLDLLITRSDSTLATSVDWTIPFLSDHYAIIASLSIPTTARPPLVKKTFRTLSKIHLPSFRHDLVNSSIFVDPQTTLLTHNTQIHDCLITLLDKHAPLITRFCPSRQTKPFITPTEFLLIGTPQ